MENSTSRTISRGSTMSRREIYKIFTNKNGRRILVVNNLVEVDKCEDLKREDFDAIFINIAHRAYEENSLTLGPSTGRLRLSSFAQARATSLRLHTYFVQRLNSRSSVCRVTTAPYTSARYSAMPSREQRYYRIFLIKLQ